MPAAGGLADHLGAPPLPLHGVGRHPELVLAPRPQLGHSVAGGAPGHLVTRVTLLPPVLHLSDSLRLIIIAVIDARLV